ncbi:MAG: bifunctional 4-hydroxy-2-oxoglutarate aldolase/2-dehydro-3-deoxy-phosphogluconate aldolase [Ruminococcus sp.]|nr:bifunctional 4-hydroxy-2-oxoglutarate aldolase/2-dehydro-3-deoxy-phosphogluconate aldolase [Ruminococcus sp.]
MSIIKQFELTGIVPVVVIDDAKDAVPLAEALIKGGLPAAEITFRTPAAKDAIAAISKSFPDLAVGAGTVLTCEQADAAVEAGAKFIVSPGLNPEVVKHVISRGVPMIPGCANASDIEAALSLGLTEVKFFPAEPLGGLKMIKALAAPYTNVRFMPTGGLNAANIGAYLDDPRIICCGGSFMVPKELIAKGDFDKIAAHTRQAEDIMLRVTFKGLDEKGRSILASSNPERTAFHMRRRGAGFFDSETESPSKGNSFEAETFILTAL